MSLASALRPSHPLAVRTSVLFVHLPASGGTAMLITLIGLGPATRPQ